MRIAEQDLIAMLTTQMDFLRGNDKDRYVAVVLAHPKTQGGLAALYSFNAELARIRHLTLREPHMGLIRLQWWRDQLTASQLPPQTSPLVLLLRHYVAIEAVDMPQLLALIDGREPEFEAAPPQTLDQVETYLAGSAGLLAACAYDMCCRSLNITRSDKEQKNISAAAVGAGLVGIMRSAGFHAGQPWCWLPRNVLQDADISQQDIARNAAPMHALTQPIRAKAHMHLKHLPHKSHKGIRGAVLPCRVAHIYLKKMDKMKNATPFDRHWVQARPPIFKLFLYTKLGII
jgi:phytoene synthase